MTHFHASRVVIFVWVMMWLPLRTGYFHYKIGSLHIDFFRHLWYVTQIFMAFLFRVIQTIMSCEIPVKMRSCAIVPCRSCLYIHLPWYISYLNISVRWTILTMAWSIKTADRSYNTHTICIKLENTFNYM